MEDLLEVLMDFLRKRKRNVLLWIVRIVAIAISVLFLYSCVRSFI